MRRIRLIICHIELKTVTKLTKKNDDIFEISQLKQNANPPLKVGVLVNSKPVSTEIGTGVSISLINC